MAAKARKKAAKAPTTKKPPKPKAGKKAKAPPTPEERLAILTQQINSKFTRSSILTGDQFSNVFILRRPIGITAMDIGIGGGFPAGGLSQIVGKEGVGKDYITNRAIANLQKIYGDQASIGLAMTELSYDKKFARLCGVDIALTAQEIAEWEESLHRKFTPEEVAWATHQTGNIQQIMSPNAEELLEITARCVQSNLYQIIVVNSFGALLTKAEEEAKEGLKDKHYGGAAMPITNFMHRIHSALNTKDEVGMPNRTSILGINQFRDNLGGDAKWNPLKIAGGWALKHGKLVDVYLDSRARIRVPGRTASEQVVVGKEIHWEVIKGKAGCHDGPKGMYPFYFGKNEYPFGADVYKDLIACGVQHGVIQMSGSWIAFSDQTFNLKAQGADAFSHLVSKTAGAFDHLRSKCFDASDTHFITRELE